MIPRVVGVGAKSSSLGIATNMRLLCLVQGSRVVVLSERDEWSMAFYGVQIQIPRAYKNTDILAMVYVIFLQPWLPTGEKRKRACMLSPVACLWIVKKKSSGLTCATFGRRAF